MEMHQSSDDKLIPMTSVSSGKLREASADVAYYTDQIVNVIFIGTAQHWVLVDAGMPKGGDELVKVAEDRFGVGNKPAAIILTHGHFDHVGGIVHLIEKWNVPVYAHPQEFPYLTDGLSYPEPDTTVEGGMLAKISSIYPNEPINIKPVLQSLPLDGTVPGLSDWQWIHVPGHSPGQVALFRSADRTLVSADAVITVRQDSMYKVLVQKKEVCGPPVYLTTDWQEAWNSVKRLYALHPEVMVPGHGTALEGEELMKGLKTLVEDFEDVAIPDYGKFVTGREKDI
jgi:glyoxylase-like metal-dependent hydrolase (beta-lactamase superfamily II)